MNFRYPTSFFLLTLFFAPFVNAETYFIPESKRGQDISVLHSESLTIDKHTSIKVSMTANGLPANNSTYLYPECSISVNGSTVASSPSKATYMNPWSYTFKDIPPGIVNFTFRFKYPGSVTSVDYSFEVLTTCPSLPDACSSLTCPYCTTTYCCVHSQHYYLTYRSDYCTYPMHTFCTDSESAYNAYKSAVNSAVMTCSLCNNKYCKICGHSCGDSSCPSRPDCSTTTCSTCKASYCANHGLHICTSVGNASNGSSGPWNVWTQQNGQNTTINVEADFQELVLSQQNANVLLNNISTTLPGFIEKQEQIKLSLDDILTQSTNTARLTEELLVQTASYQSSVMNFFDALDDMCVFYGESLESITSLLNIIKNTLSEPLKLDTTSFDSLLTSIKSNTTQLKENVSSIDETTLSIHKKISELQPNINTIASNVSDIKTDTSIISSNTKSLVSAAESINTSLSDITSDVSDIKSNSTASLSELQKITPSLHEIKSDTQVIKDTASEQVKSLGNIDSTLTEVNTSLQDLKKNIIPNSPPSTQSYNLKLPTITDPNSYKTDIGPIDSSSSLPTEKISSTTEKIQNAVDKMPSVTVPTYDNLILNVPLHTDFYDFSFTLDLSGGRYHETVTKARNISHACFSIFWILSFTFLFIKTLRQW